MYLLGHIANDSESAAVPADADYGVLFDPKYAGKLAVWDDISSIADTATYMGYDNVWDLSDEELEAVKAKMIEQKPLLRKYWDSRGRVDRTVPDW